MEELMRLLWHLNAETNSLYEVRTQAEELLREAEAFSGCGLSGEQARFFARELAEAEGHIGAAEDALRALRGAVARLAAANPGPSGQTEGGAPR